MGRRRSTCNGSGHDTIQKKLKLTLTCNAASSEESRVDHYKDVVEDRLWQVHVNMLEVPSSECLPSDKSWAQIALKRSLSAPNDEAMMPS